MKGTPTPHHIRTRRAYDGRLLKVDVDTMRTVDGAEFDIELIRHPGAAAVVPFVSDPSAEDPTVLLIRQYRHAAGGSIWEVPAGVLEVGEEPEACARRELLEETGAQAGRLEHLTTVYTTPGFTDEQIHLFLATDLTVKEPQHQGDEFIQVRAKPLSEVLRMIRDGEIVDGKSISALLFLAGFRLNL